MYTPYYRTPRIYLSGYLPNGQPLPPHAMMDDIVGDYKDKTVTLEDFPFFANNIKMASIHPCKHAPVMKTLLDRADAALRIRREKLRAGKISASSSGGGGAAVEGGGVALTGMEGLVDEIERLDVKGAQEAADKEEWEEVQGADIEDQEVAIRVDQYLVVFLKVTNYPLSSSHTLLFFETSILTKILSSWPVSLPASSMISQWVFKTSLVHGIDRETNFFLVRRGWCFTNFGYFCFVTKKLRTNGVLGADLARRIDF